MATVNHVNLNLNGISAVGRVTSWTPITAANATGSPMSPAGEGDLCVQVTGTFNGATIALRGSNLTAPNDATAADWFQLTRADGTAASQTAAGGYHITERPLWISPISSGGGGSSSLTINLYSSR